MSPQRLRLLRGCVAYILRCRYAAWLWLPPQDPAAKLPPNRRPLWLPLHCAAARQEASLRFVPRQPNPQKKEQHQENSRSSLISAFSPFCSLIKSTKPVSAMLARRGLVPGGRGYSRDLRLFAPSTRCQFIRSPQRRQLPRLFLQFAIPGRTRSRPCSARVPSLPHTVPIPVRDWSSCP